MKYLVFETTDRNWRVVKDIQMLGFCGQDSSKKLPKWHEVPTIFLAVQEVA